MLLPFFLTVEQMQWVTKSFSIIKGPIPEIDSNLATRAIGLQWVDFLYILCKGAPVNLKNNANNPKGSDVENPVASSQVYMNTQFGLVYQELQLMFWKVSELLCKY